MVTDQLQKFKAAQREGWGLFQPIEMVTLQCAPPLVAFAEVSAGQKVLDVGCGTGVVAITAARQGAIVSGLDLSPKLLEHAKANTALAQLSIDYLEGDVEQLPYANNSFDVVLSQFGHMFAPRPELALAEMLRVLKPGGKIAFSTWPPHLYVGRMFSLVNRFFPPPAGVTAPSSWGDAEIITKRLGESVKALFFEGGLMRFPALSVAHYCKAIEATIGPVVKLVQAGEENTEMLRTFREELTQLAAEYFSDNCIRSHFLMTRAIKI